MRNIIRLLRCRINMMLPSLISIYLIFLISGTYIFSDCRFGVENHFSYYIPYIIANFAIAFIFSFFISLFKGKCRIIISYILIALFSFLTILEGLIVLRYDVFFNAFILDAVIHTNPIEANAVLKDNILNIVILLISFFIITVLFIILYKKTFKLLDNRYFKNIAHIIVYVLLIVTLCVPPAYFLLRNVQKFSFYFFGISNQVERIAVAFYNSYENRKSYGKYIDDNLDFLHSNNHLSCPNDSLDCIVIIGESYAKSHSSLYGYKYNTCPLEKKLVESGDMFVFKDAITCDNGTQSVFMKLFNFHGSNSKLLLPTVFKKCGFNCVNYDNEFLVTNNYDIWYDNKLISDALYSYRNNSCTDLDEDMLNKMKINGTRHNFYFIHLVGQHFPYNKHFPKSYCKFNSKDYQTKYGKDADQQLADYDNCTLYNDYIIYSIIKKFENRHAIVFYLPDHGEELYDYRNFKGHGNTINDRKGLIQVEIPFVIWVSSKYKKDHPEIISKLYKSVNNKFISTMLSNTVLDAAGIKCIYSNPTFSIINDKFDNKRHRITAYGYDYDRI